MPWEGLACLRKACVVVGGLVAGGVGLEIVVLVVLVLFEGRTDAACDDLVGREVEGPVEAWFGVVVVVLLSLVEVVANAVFFKTVVGACGALTPCLGGILPPVLAVVIVLVAGLSRLLLPTAGPNPRSRWRIRAAALALTRSRLLSAGTVGVNWATLGDAGVACASAGDF